jgi:hypothetical protein
MRRRDLLKLGLLAPFAAPFVPLAARAFGEVSLFTPALAQHGGGWQARKNGLHRLANELSARTSTPSLPQARAIALTDPALFTLPFLYLGSDVALPPLEEVEVAALRRYLTYGGFLLAEANDPTAPGIDGSFRRELARVLPQAPLERLGQDHVVYKTFYLLDHPYGRVAEAPYMEAQRLGKRAAVVYSRNDMAGAWSRDDRGGGWDFDVQADGERGREMAIRTGVNLAMYALCLDYKEDAVHLPSIMKRRR